MEGQSPPKGPHSHHTPMLHPSTWLSTLGLSRRKPSCWNPGLSLKKSGSEDWWGGGCSGASFHSCPHPACAWESRCWLGLQEVFTAFPGGWQPGRGWPVGVWPSRMSAAFLLLALANTPQLARHRDLFPTSSSSLQMIPSP